MKSQMKQYFDQLGSEGIESIQSHRRSKIGRDLCNDFNQWSDNCGW